MKPSNSDRQRKNGAKTPPVEDLISNYEIAVLSTLFEADDSDKISDLAKQWGYQQEFLESVWQEIHQDTTRLHEQRKWRQRKAKG